LRNSLFVEILYNQVGEQGMKKGGSTDRFHGLDPFDISNMFFSSGGASPFGSRQEHRGKKC
jgi:hypothetical protein